MKRNMVGLTVALAVVIAGALGWFGLRAPLVMGVEMRVAPLVRSLQFSARVASLSRVDVGSTITGRVAKVMVAEGANVRQGEVLLQLEADDQRAALLQAQAAVSQARSRLEGLRSTGRASVKAALMQAEATLRAAQAELVRSQQLVAQGFVSASRVDDAQRAVGVARAQLDSAQAQTLANGDGGTDIVQAGAQLEQARASAVSAQARLAQTQVLAPADARVLGRQVEPGQIVQPGKALMSLALAGPTQISAQVDERFLGQLEVGQAATVVADAFAAQRLAAKVLTLAPAIDAQRGAVEVKLALDKPPPAFLREDMTLSVEVETGRRERALVLPLGALRNQLGAAGNGAEAARGSVMVATQGRTVLRPVRVGMRTLDAAEVLEGLAEGDVVLLGAVPKPDKAIRVQLQAWQPGAPGGASNSGQDASSALTNAMGR